VNCWISSTETQGNGRKTFNHFDALTGVTTDFCLRKKTFFICIRLEIAGFSFNFALVMVFYFTGTGNSRWIAQRVAEAFSEEPVAMSDFFEGDQIVLPTFTLRANEHLGFVFPVHAWGVPPLVCKFIQQLQLKTYNGQLIYGVFTCGDECGYTREMFVQMIKEKGWDCHHVYSVQMPNTYIVFPGFDVDPKELETAKIAKARLLLPSVIKAINDDKPIDAYRKGRLPFLKSRVIYPQFIKHALNSRPFYTTDACISCGRCVEFCPAKNLSMKEHKPLWGDHCVQCLSCLHRCPTRAIEYGKLTRNKGRYYFRENQR
jgi:NAD-dependent dihydropyrimidine dehydrogenase PreA subunit/flavodoxin